MKIAFHSPLPPAPTGVADYAAALVPALRELGEIDLNPTNDPFFTKRTQSQKRTPSQPKAFLRNEPNPNLRNEPGNSEPQTPNSELRTPNSLPLYHIGNNHLHRNIYARALRQPGIVVLHDAVLHHFFLGSLTEQQYVDEFVYNYGSWHIDLARSLWNTRARSATDPRYFEYPMLKRLAEQSLAVIVHNPAAAEMVKAHAPATAVHEIPHLFVPPELPPLYDVERLRAKLNVRPSTFFFGVFGHLRESKRLIPILRAFETVRSTTDAALLIAGDFASTDLARSVEPLLHAPGIVRAHYLPEREFWLHASTVDACINLRYPAAGETSGIAIRFMGIGKPVILSNGLEVSRFPDAACIRIDTGATEEPMLCAAMRWLAACPADAREIGARAAKYVAERHAIDAVAAQYWSAITSCYDVQHA